MIEKEVKIRVTSKDKLHIVEEYLVKSGGVLRGKYVVVDEYFSHPCKDFKKTDEALRIRVQSGEIILTYKCSRISRMPKVREEISARVSDYEAMRNILLKLGFTPLARIVKYRKEYVLKEIQVFIDDVKELGCFIEVECENEKSLMEFLNMLEKMEVLGGVEERTYLEMYLELKSQRAR